MEGVTIMLYGALIGSWLTSLWLMRENDRLQKVDEARLILNKVYDKCRTGLTFAPDMNVSSELRISINGASYLLTLKPVKEDA